jgi:hypothetical protein
MKRLLPLLLSLILLICCTPSAQNVFENEAFSVSVPEPFEQVCNVPITCFAPYGDPLLSSSITYSATELNWYFDKFTDSEYDACLKELCGYEELKLISVDHCRIDGYDAKRIACKVKIDQGIHDLVVYAINADRTCFFTLLNRENDSYNEAFDAMMQTVRLKEGK